MEYKEFPPGDQKTPTPGSHYVALDKSLNLSTPVFFQLIKELVSPADGTPRPLHHHQMPQCFETVQHG